MCSGELLSRDSQESVGSNLEESSKRFSSFVETILASQTYGLGIADHYREPGAWLLYVRYRKGQPNTCISGSSQ